MFLIAFSGCGKNAAEINNELDKLNSPNKTEDTPSIVIEGTISRIISELSFRNLNAQTFSNEIFCQKTCLTARCLNLTMLDTNNAEKIICKTDIKADGTYNFNIQNPALLSNKILRIHTSNFNGETRETYFKLQTILNGERKTIDIDFEKTMLAKILYYDIMTLGNNFNFNVFTNSLENILKLSIKTVCTDLQDLAIDELYSSHFDSLISDNIMLLTSLSRTSSDLESLRLNPSVVSMCTALKTTINPEPENDDDNNPVDPPIVVTKTAVSVPMVKLITKNERCHNSESCLLPTNVLFITTIKAKPKKQCTIGEDFGYNSSNNSIWTENNCSIRYRYLLLDANLPAPLLAVNKTSAKLNKTVTLYFYLNNLIEPSQEIEKISFNENKTCLTLEKVATNIYACKIKFEEVGQYEIKVETTSFIYTITSKLTVQ